MTDPSRIEQFRTLAEQDPNDELAHFSLGNALFEAEQFQEAAQSFQRVVALNNQNSKAQERLGAAQIKCGDSELAIQTLRNGYIIAHKKGDLEPMNAMGTLLQELGTEPPAIGQKKTGVQGEKGSTGDWSCCRCGGSGPKLTERPFKGELGEKVLETVCLNCWTEWVAMGTKVINELKLPMYDPAAQETYDKHMVEFLSLE